MWLRMRITLLPDSSGSTAVLVRVGPALSLRRSALPSWRDDGHIGLEDLHALFAIGKATLKSWAA